MPKDQNIVSKELIFVLAVGITLLITSLCLFFYANRFLGYILFIVSITLILSGQIITTAEYKEEDNKLTKYMTGTGAVFLILFLSINALVFASGQSESLLGITKKIRDINLRITCNDNDEMFFDNIYASIDITEFEDKTEEFKIYMEKNEIIPKTNPLTWSFKSKNNSLSIPFFEKINFNLKYENNDIYHPILAKFKYNNGKPSLTLAIDDIQLIDCNPGTDDSNTNQSKQEITDTSNAIPE